MNPPRCRLLNSGLGYFRMKCMKCGHVLEPEAPRTVEAELKGEHVSVELTSPQCASCGEVVLLGKHVRAYHRAVSDAYRRKVGLLTIDEIDSLGRNLNMTLQEFADYVFVGIATLKRWRRGEIQTQALDRLVRLRADPRFLEEAKAELDRRLADAAFLQEVPRRPCIEWASNFDHSVEYVAAVSVSSSARWKEASSLQQSVAA